MHCLMLKTGIGGGHGALLVRTTGWQLLRRRRPDPPFLRCRRTPRPRPAFLTPRTGVKSCTLLSMSMTNVLLRLSQRVQRRVLVPRRVRFLSPRRRRLHRAPRSRLVVVQRVRQRTLAALLRGSLAATPRRGLRFPPQPLQQLPQKFLLRFRDLNFRSRFRRTAAPVPRVD